MVNLDAKIASVTAEVDLSLGSVTTSTTDGAKAVLDFFDSSNDSNSGFTPQFSTQGPSVSAGISASANFGPNIVLGLDVAAFGQGLAASLALAVPQLDLTASLNENGCSGVDFEAELSAQLIAFGGAGNIADMAASDTISLVGTFTQVLSTCLKVPGASTAPARRAAATTATTASVPTASATPSASMVQSTLSDAGCQMALNDTAAMAAGVCASDGGDYAFTTACDGHVDLCCSDGQACGMAILSRSVYHMLLLDLIR